MNASNPDPKSFPVEIARANAHDVKIRWNDGAENVYPARLLRLSCSCAACVEEMTGRRIVTDADVVDGVHPVKISQVGRYAIHIGWSDGHASGIYGFDYLKRLAGNLS